MSLPLPISGFYQFHPQFTFMLPQPPTANKHQRDGAQLQQIFEIPPSLPLQTDANAIPFQASALSLSISEIDKPDSESAPAPDSAATDNSKALVVAAKVAKNKRKKVDVTQTDANPNPLVPSSSSSPSPAATTGNGLQAPKDKMTCLHGYVNGNFYRYHGHTKDSKPHGKGIWQDLAANTAYEGEFRDGRKCGIGTFTTPGYSISGKFENNFPNGLITCKNRFFTTTGQMKDGKFVGNCLMVANDCSERYEGPLFKMLKHGQGRIDNGDTSLSGIFCLNEIQLGTLINTETGETIYEGPFFEGKLPEGEFTHKQMADKTIFSITGLDKVKIFYLNGDVYIGPVKDELKHGRGILYFANGHHYEGDFLNDTMHGEGVLHEEGGVHQGQFGNNKKHGEGTYTREKCYPERGTWVNDVKVTNGASFFKKG